jgi:hypothetical protein
MADKLMQVVQPNPGNARAMYEIASLSETQQELLLGFMGQSRLPYRYVHIAEVVELFDGCKTPMTPSDRKALHTNIIKYIEKDPEFGRTAHPTSAVQKNTKPRSGGLTKGSYTIFCLDDFEAHTVHPVVYQYRKSWVVSIRDFFG